MNMVKYFIRGTVKGSRCYDNYTDDIADYELPEYAEDIEKLFTKDKNDELAQYIRDDSIIYGVVTEIWVGVKIIKGHMCSWTEVTANRELTKAEKLELLDYLTGQFSDGYGEGLEQQEFLCYNEAETLDEWDEEEQEFFPCDYEVNVSCYLHLWQWESFMLEFVEAEENKVEAEEMPKSNKPACKLIGEDGNIFNLMGLAARALREAGMSDAAKQMPKKIYSEAKDYYDALRIISEYVEVE